MNSFYKEVKIFNSKDLLVDLIQYKYDIDMYFTYSNYPSPFTIYKKGEENNYKHCEIAIGDWLVSHGAEYGEYVLID
jgi:hypothetical protein